MRRARDIARPAACNWKPFAAFEALYKMAAVLLFVPLLFGTFALVMKLEGYAYLTHENIRAFLLSPLALLAFAVIGLLAAVYVMIDVSAVVFALDQSVQGVKITQSQLLRFALRNTARAWKPGDLLLVPAVLGLLPLVSVGFAAGLLTTVSLPGFLVRYVRARPALQASLAAAVAAMTALGMHWRYGVYFFALENCSFAAARKKCAALGRGLWLRDLAVFIVSQACFSLVYMLLLLLVMGLAGILGRSFSEIFLLKWLTSSAVWLGLVLTLAVIAALAVPVGYGCAGVLFYRRLTQLHQPLPHAAAPGPNRDPRLRKGARLLRAAAVCAVTAGSLTLGFLLSTGGINPDVEYLHTMEITAHRGASAFYPENTMAAFAGAMDMGADWIELDVQQTADGQLVVTHDANLKRVTGVNANVWELTYAQIARLDAGSFFSPDYGGERIPRLEDVLAFAGENGLKLNIELKPTGHETDLESSVVDALRTAELTDSCVITSQAYQSLERVKAYDETITTVYVMRFAYGSIGRLSAADAFSVEAASVTRALVSQVHNAGKSLYVWTVNTKKSITKMIELSVDNIITDNIDLAKQCVYESRYSDLTEEYVDMLH